MRRRHLLITYQINEEIIVQNKWSTSITLFGSFRICFVSISHVSSQLKAIFVVVEMQQMTSGAIEKIVLMVNFIGGME